MPCQNGALCQSSINRYTCTCSAGFTGVNCHLKITPCNSSPCMYGGTCEDFYNGNYRCICPLAYTGPNCEFLLDFCINNPCYNNGTCISNPSTLSYSCQCLSGFTGVRLEYLLKLIYIYFKKLIIFFKTDVNLQ